MRVCGVGCAALATSPMRKPSPRRVSATFPATPGRSEAFATCTVRSDGRGPAAAPVAVAGSGASVRSASKRVAASPARSTEPWSAGSGSVGTGAKVTPVAPRSRMPLARARTWSRSAASVVRAWPSAGRRAATRRRSSRPVSGQRRAEHGGQHLLLAFDAAAPGGGVAFDGRGPGEVGGLARVEADRARGRDDRAERRVDDRPRGAEPHAGEGVDGVAEAGEVQPDVAGDRQAGQLLHGAGGAAGAAEVERAGELRAGLCGHGVAGVGGRRAAS